GNDNGNTTVTGNNSGTLTLSGTLGAVERSLQTLAYTATATGTDPITVTVSDYAGTAAPVTITALNSSTGLQFNWKTTTGQSFSDNDSWTPQSGSADTPPGGTNVAYFGAGTYTVPGDGAVGEIVVNGTATLTGQITAQGRSVALTVDSGGALTLAGG